MFTIHVKSSVGMAWFSVIKSARWTKWKVDFLQFNGWVRVGWNKDFLLFSGILIYPVNTPSVSKLLGRGNGFALFLKPTIINHPLLNAKAKGKNPFYEVRTSSNSFGTEGGCFGARYLSGTYPHGMVNIDYNINNNYDVTLKLRKKSC